MFGFHFRLSNPFARDESTKGFDHYKNWALGENKTVELQTYRNKATIIEFSFDFRTGHRDHAGLNVDFGLLSYVVDFSICDNRHWDRETGTWQKYDEDK